VVGRERDVTRRNAAAVDRPRVLARLLLHAGRGALPGVLRFVEGDAAGILRLVEREMPGILGVQLDAAGRLLGRCRGSGRLSSQAPRRAS